MGGPNQHNTDKKNTAKGGVQADLTKTIVIKKVQTNPQNFQHVEHSRLSMGVLKRVIENFINISNPGNNKECSNVRKLKIFGKHTKLDCAEYSTISSYSSVSAE